MITYEKLFKEMKKCKSIEEVNKLLDEVLKEEKEIKVSKKKTKRRKK